ncbi:heterokaryon incompatibility protein-domain-containing protein [Nemania sp. FL0916]|nr:heterokaryon incompatibility protein-domain-containing protein [Nemania sp. FL0916]
MEAITLNVEETFDVIDKLSVEELHAYAELHEETESYEHMASYLYTQQLLCLETGSPRHQREINQKLDQWLSGLTPNHPEYIRRASAVREIQTSSNKRVQKRLLKTHRESYVSHLVQDLPESEFEDLRSSYQIAIHVVAEILPGWKFCVSKSHTVLDMVQQLGAQSEMFSFIKSALSTYMEEVEKNVIIRALAPMVEELGPLLMSESRGTWSRGELAKVMISFSLHVDAFRNTVLAEDFGPILTAGHTSNIHNLCQIIDALIYEILWVFDFDIPQAPVSRCSQQLDLIESHLALLQKVFLQSRSMKPARLGGVTDELDAPLSDERDDYASNYEYTSDLDSSEGCVRVLLILPGVGESPLKCRLIEWNVYEDAIPEALSYVWGSESPSQAAIWLDGKLFPITTRLYNILHHLRRVDDVRAIWVDAICINQTNKREKVHQVRLMRNIYSTTKNTVVWLDDPDTSSDRGEKTENYDEPLPEGFVRVTINRYDLSTLLHEWQKCSDREPESERSSILFLMLWVLAFHIISNEWWERVWTLQEAILPQNSPILHFKGYCFPLDDFIAVQMVVFSKKEDDQKESLQRLNSLTNRDEHMRTVQFYNRHLDLRVLNPLASWMRRLRTETKAKVISLGSLLYFTAALRASNPSDKVFALESLLPENLGRLIKVDYHEDAKGSVFRRIIARYYSSEGVDLTRSHAFLCEAQRPPSEIVDSPSWILDLTSDTVRFGYSA